MGLLDTAAEAVAPPWLSIPLKVLGGIKAAMAWLFAQPWRILAACLAVALFFAFHYRADYLAEKDGWAKDKAAFELAQKQAAAKAASQKTKDEAAIAQFSGVTNHDYEDGLADGRRQLAAYVAGRVRDRNQGATGQPAAPAPDHAPGLPEGTAPAPAVAFTEQQLTGWDRDYEYGLACYKWGQGIARRFDGQTHPADVPTPPTAPNH